MQRLTIAFVLMAAAALPRAWTPIPVSFTTEEQPAAPAPAESARCCDGGSHVTHLLCLHRLVVDDLSHPIRYQAGTVTTE